MEFMHSIILWLWAPYSSVTSLFFLGGGGGGMKPNDEDQEKMVTHK